MSVAAHIALSVLLVAPLALAGAPEHARKGTWNSALGVTCVHCHVEGRPEDPSKPTFDFARRMNQMVRGLNSGPLRGIGRISCVTCHRGQTRPARLPLAAWQSVEKANQAAFEGTPEGTGLSMSVYTASLGVGCDHCHAKGDWTSSGKPPYRISRVMTSLFEHIPRYFEGSERKPRTQCFMCHQGGIRPAR